jgi:lipopolysaccharide export system protein LptA
VRRLLGVAAVVLLCVVHASAQPAPVVVDADTITYDAAQQTVVAQGNVRITSGRHRMFADAATYDVRRELLTATGRVRVLDDRGREMRGHTLTFNTRTEEGTLDGVVGIIDRERRVYVRGDRLEFNPERYIGYQTLTTTCDPERPLFAVTARRVEIVPNQEIVAYDAAVLVAGRRVFATPRFDISLVPDEPGVLVPGFGANEVDGFWAEYQARVTLPDARGIASLKYTTSSGWFPYLRLTHRAPTFSATVRLGRTRTIDEREAFTLLPYTVAEASIENRRAPIAGTPLSHGLSVAAGWFDDPTAGVATTRLDGALSVRSEAIPLAPGLVFATGASLRVSAYGTGDVRTVASYVASLTRSLDPHTRATLRYHYVLVTGRSPLLIDDVDPANTLSLSVARVVPDRYRWTVGASHNWAVPETKFTASAFIVTSPSLEVGVFAVYNTRLARFEDLDYTVRWICDCVDVIVRYRQAKREFSVEVGLIGFSDRREMFVPRSPRPSPLAPVGDPARVGGDLH